MLFFKHKLANASAAILLWSLCLLACTICLLVQQLVCFNRFPDIISLQPQHTNLCTHARVISGVWQSLVNRVDEVDWRKMSTSGLSAGQRARSIFFFFFFDMFVFLKCNGLSAGPGAWQVQL